MTESCRNGQQFSLLDLSLRSSSLQHTSMKTLPTKHKWLYDSGITWLFDSK
ncbi:MAG: hypothetical protein ACTS73_04885 [Arsenophonus sp. NEOnobi-MAG3]